MAEEEKGFVIRDRRGVEAEPEGKAETPRQPSEQEKQPPGQPPPPVNFLSFIYSMGTSALMLLGEPIGPGGAAQTPNLMHAQEIIDILTMLEAKTKGNLTGEEETLLEEMLYTLRIKFVEKAKAPKA
ncbi:MAG: DUF1844 domain-containing protein [Nitrospirae bacterium]|nr:MAG: DUF1844 domain-containing protein [Nitrospirota bacterium]